MDSRYTFYAGANSSKTISEALVKSLEKKTHDKSFYCDLTLSNQYAYFAFPSELGIVEFIVSGFAGGFEDPVQVSVDNVQYNVYRSAQVLTGNVTVKYRYGRKESDGHLETSYTIRPNGNFPIVEAENVDIDGQRVNEAIYELRRNQTADKTEITIIKSDITEMSSDIAQNSTDISDIQTQIQSLGKTIKIKGRVNTVNDLPTTASEGDMYFVGTATAESFEEYVYTEQKKWEYLGSINDVDLSDYVTKSFLSNTLGGYAKLSDIPTVPTDYLTGGSQTSKSTADGGKNVYTFVKSDGTTSTLEVYNGTKGSKGDTGPQGEQGIQGIQGPQGLKGDTGSTGATGPQGPKGDTGATGAKGDTGDTGATGPQGPAGKNGTNGVSCTHSWSGTTLTVTSASGTSSANLKGDKGDKGDTGATGSTGPQGPAGTNGTTPTIKAANGANIGTVGTPAVTASTSGATTTFTFNYLKGAKGDKGDKGDTGAAGSDGKNGTNGSNGVSCTHSWSGTTLSVTSASGTSSANLKGEKGDKGDTGATGPQGPAGQNATTTAVFSTSANGLAPKSTNTSNFLRGDGTWQPVITSHQSLAGKQDVILSAKPTIKTGSTAMAKISLNTLFAWLISQNYIASNTYQMKTFRTSWSYAANDILQLSANGANFEVHLAGCEISFIGTATAYNTGEFVLTITAAPTSSFTLTSGYTDGKNSTFVYRCNGSSYSPNWQRYVTSAYSLNKTVPSDAKFTDTTYSAATTSANGLMSSADKTKLDGIATGATAVSSSTVSGWGYTKNTGTVTQVKVGTTAYNPSSGVVSLPAYPTSLPASDVSSWAKAASKPTYSADEVGALSKQTWDGAQPSTISLAAQGNGILTMPRGWLLSLVSIIRREKQPPDLFVYDGQNVVTIYAHNTIAKAEPTANIYEVKVTNGGNYTTTACISRLC